MRIFILACLLLLQSTITYSESRKGSVPFVDAPKIIPFDPELSSGVKDLIDSGHYEIKEKRRSKWDLSVSGERMYSTFKEPLYPFPIVKGYSKKGVLKAPNWDKSDENPPADWTFEGLTGVGPILSVSSYDEGGQFPHNRILAGTQASGIYYRGGARRNFSKLESFPRKSAQSVLINPKDPKHFIVLSRYLLTRNPTQIFQSCDRGVTWEVSEDLKVINSLGNEVGLLADEMELVNDTLTLVGLDTSKENVFVVSGEVGCKKITKKAPADPLDFKLVLRQEFVGASHGRLKMSRWNGLVSIKDGETDRLYRSTDGGVTWQEFMKLEESYWFSSYNSLGPGGFIITLLGRDKDDTSLTTRIMRSRDAGATWTTTTPSTLVIKNNGRITKRILRKEDPKALNIDFQDIALRPHFPNYIAAFGYMDGFLESTDGGKTFTAQLGAFESVKYLPTRSGVVQAIVPEDLRGDQMVIDSFFARTLLPSDQGLFQFNKTENALLKNLLPDAHLVQSKRVGVTECPRLYSGLWHVGAYWINEDGSVSGFNGAESDGFGLGENAEDKCGIPAYSLAHGILPDGVTLDLEVSKSLRASLKEDIVLAWPFSGAPHYVGGSWWYYNPVQLTLWRLVEFGYRYVQEYPNSDSSNFARAFGAHGNEAFYIIDKNYNLYRYTNAAGWDLLGFVDVAIPPGGTDPRSTMGKQLVMQGQTVLWMGADGVIITSDHGASFKHYGAGSYYPAGYVDACGWIYLARIPGKDGLGGVYISKDGGANFEKLGTEDAESYILGFTMRESTRFLYATTYGESLLRYKMPNCDGSPNRS